LFASVEGISTIVDCWARAREVPARAPAIEAMAWRRVDMDGLIGTSDKSLE
jgi:hypothetical protein